MEPKVSYKEIVRLTFSGGYSQREIAAAANCSCGTVSNVAALRFFGGAPRIVVPDNLRTGISAHTPDEVVVNRTYREFGEQYGLAIVPTGVRKPKHKPSVECPPEFQISVDAILFSLPQSIFTLPD